MRDRGPTDRGHDHLGPTAPDRSRRPAIRRPMLPPVLRRVAAGALLAVLAGPAAAQSPAAPADPVAAQSQAAPADPVAEAYRRGFTDGVAAVNAQLGAVTAQIQRDVQAQVNAQLARLDAERSAELADRLSAAQKAALAAQGPVGAAPSPAPVTNTMPRLPPLARAPGGGIAPVAPLPRDQAAATRIEARPAHPAGPRLPDDPAALPPGTTITITDPQGLPPDLYRALIGHIAR